MSAVKSGVKGLIKQLRRKYHESLCETILGRRGGDGAITCADSNSETSCTISELVVQNIGCTMTASPKTGQTAGKIFEDTTADFLKESLDLLQHLRPGNRVFSTSQKDIGIAIYDQYEHLAQLKRFLEEQPSIAAALGDYLITPDIVIAKSPVDDEKINSKNKIVDDDPQIARFSPFRASNNPSSPTLHATVSCKWTLRSDRAQNARTEALNLIRNRKGKTPHITVMTFEPMPTRLQSIALGTGDIDCVYHGALPELQEAVAKSNRPDQVETLNLLIDGRRLRDISDLPFDLII